MCGILCIVTNKVIHEKADANKTNTSEKYVMTKERDGLEGLHLGELFSLENNSLGVATITSEITGRTFYVSDEILEECFSKAAEISVDINECDISVSEEDVDEILEASEFKVFTVFDKCTVVSCKLPNGFVITESSASVSPNNYSQDMGVEICKRKIKDKVFELEAYFLQEVLANASVISCDEDCSCECCGECCQGDCDHCCEE